MILGKQRNNNLSLYLNETKTERCHEVAFLRVTIEEELNFKKHLENIFCVAKYKLYVFQWIGRCLNTEKTNLLANAFINSDFCYESMIWMFAGISLDISISGYLYSSKPSAFASNRDLRICL